MNVWRAESAEAKRPEVLGTRTLLWAFALHFAFFLLLYLYSVFHFRAKEEIIPIDLTVVVVENLDGEENEPPPLKKIEEPPPPPPKPKSEPPKPKPKPREPEKPKELEKIVTNIVEKVEKKPEKTEPEEKKPEKKPEKPKEPQKTKEQIRRERIEQMKKSAKDVKSTTRIVQPQPNGRTAKKTLSDAEIQKLLNMGYRPGATTNLAKDDLSLAYSLIKMAFEKKWETPPWTDRLRPMVLQVRFGGGGRVLGWKLVSSSGDAQADQTIKSAASRVGSVPGLPAEFIREYGSKGVKIEFTVDR